jgi:hypothetical protein
VVTTGHMTDYFLDTFPCKVNKVGKDEVAEILTRRICLRNAICVDGWVRTSRLPIWGLCCHVEVGHGRGRQARNGAINGLA